MIGALQDLFSAADLLLLGGDVPDALDRLAQAAALAPDNPEPYFRRAEILVRQGAPEDLQAALDALDTAQACGLATVDLHFLRMRACIELGQAEAARAAYAAAVAVAPEDARLREWAVRLALAVGDPVAALVRVQAERAADPDNFCWARWEAELLLETGATAKAVAAYSALLADHCPADLIAGDWAAPAWAAILYGRAAAFDRLGDLSAAQADRARAASLIPTSVASSP